MSQPPNPQLRRTAALLVALLALVAGSVSSIPARAADTKPDSATPLTVHLVRLAPAAIPTKGRLVLAGTVTNGSTQTWASVNVHPFISPTPITNRDALAAAAKSDPATEVGTRLVAQNQFATIGELVPGATAPFRISLKVKDLPIDLSAQGVYWIGVHALGQDAAGGIRETLGRARTLIPLVRGTQQTSVAVVVPVRQRVLRDNRGRVLDNTAWSSILQPGGRLGRLASFVASAGLHPMTLLIDPAVIDAVGNLKADNPPLTLGTGAAPSGQPSSSPTPTPTPSRSEPRPDPAERANAASWLDQIVAAAKAHTTLGLGYADPDSNSLARRRPGMLALAQKLAGETFATYGIPAVPALAPPDGSVDDDLLNQVQAETTVLVSDHSAPPTRTQWRTSTHQDLVFTDAQAASGGPAPGDPTDALALRQRIISDAALRISQGATTPMVVKLPDDWNPGDSWQLADFFNSLAQPWLNLVALNPTSDLTTPTFRAPLGYPASARRSEIGATNVGAARTLIQTATVLNSLLRSTNVVAHDLAGAALEAVSYNAHHQALRTREQVLATNQAMRATLSKVQVIGTDFVTLSGGSGSLAVTLVNGLDQPVLVGVRPKNLPSDVRIDSAEPVRMTPGERTVLRLHADSSGVGVTQVVLTPVTAVGTPLGTPLTFRLRTSQVGVVIWGVLGAGGLLLVVMILRRIRRAMREHRWRR